MTQPYHSQYYVGNGGIFRGLFYLNYGEFELRLEQPDGTTRCGGKWPSLDLASDAARDLAGASKPAARLPEVVVGSWLARGYKVMSCKKWRSDEWWIIAYRGKLYEDTGLRFNSEEEAVKAVACA